MEELDQKVQEAVSKVMETLDEWVAGAVERAVKKLVAKLSEEGKKLSLVAPGSSGGS